MLFDCELLPEQEAYGERSEEMLRSDLMTRGHTKELKDMSDLGVDDRVDAR